MSEIVAPTDNRPGTRILKTKARDVLVVGTELVSARFLDVVKYVLDFVADGEDHGVNSIILSDIGVPITVSDETQNGWIPVMADAAMHAGAITINLEETIQKCFETTVEANIYSLYGVWWHNMLINIIHETLHCADFVQDAKPWEWLANYLKNEDGFADKMEKETELASKAVLKSLAQQVDIEPPNWGEETYFAEYATDLYAGEDGESETAIRWLNDRIFVWVCDPDTKDPAPICDFHGYMQAISGDLADDKDWTGKLLVIESDVPAANEKLKDGFGTTTQETPAATATPIVEDADGMYMEDAIDVDYDDVEEGPAGVEDTTEGVVFSAAQFGAFNMAPADAMPSIPTSAAPAPQPQQTQQAPVAPAAGPTLANEVAGSFGFGPNGASTAPTVAPSPAPQPAAAPQYQPASSPQVQNLVNLNLDPAEIRRRFFDVANKLHNHIFTVCEPQGGPLEADEVRGFNNPDAVTKIPVMITAEEAQVVVACDGLDDMGRWMPRRPTSDGKLFGWVASKAKLPMYKLYCNFNGQQLVRLIVPQNPNTRNSANYLKTSAQAARNKQAITWIREGDDAVKAATGKSLLFKRLNGNTWEAMK
jgi:hypothetical protein